MSIGLNIIANRLARSSRSAATHLSISIQTWARDPQGHFQNGVDKRTYVHPDEGE